MIIHDVKEIVEKDDYIIITTGAVTIRVPTDAYPLLTIRHLKYLKDDYEIAIDLEIYVT